MLPGAAILSVLLALTPHYSDSKEPPISREQRMLTIAFAIQHAEDRATCTGDYAKTKCKAIWPRSQQLELQALLITTAYFESGLALHIHQGKCGPRECDPYKYHGKIVHKARSLWQLQRSSLVESEWPHMNGVKLQPTEHAAWGAAKALAAGRRVCKRYGTLHGAISGYATGGKTCVWRGAPRRAKFALRVYAKLQSAP